jgi:hypothetical protein
MDAVQSENTTDPGVHKLGQLAIVGCLCAALTHFPFCLQHIEIQISTAGPLQFVPGFQACWQALKDFCPKTKGAERALDEIRKPALVAQYAEQLEPRPPAFFDIAIPKLVAQPVSVFTSLAKHA